MGNYRDRDYLSQSTIAGRPHNQIQRIKDSLKIDDENKKFYNVLASKRSSIDFKKFGRDFKMQTKIK
jgi:hypothetical protein